MATGSDKFYWWDTDLLTGETVQSPSVYRLLGYDPDEPFIKSYNDLLPFIHPEDLSSLNDNIQRHLRGETPFHSFKFRVRTRPGEWHRLHSLGMVVAHDAHGNPARFAGISRDAASDRRGPPVHEGGGVSDMNPDRTNPEYGSPSVGENRIQVWECRLDEQNLPFELPLLSLPSLSSRSFGFSRVDVPPESKAFLAAAFRNHLEGRTPVLDCEYRILDPRGCPRWHRVQGEIVRNSEGAPLRITGIETELAVQERPTNPYYLKGAELSSGSLDIQATYNLLQTLFKTAAQESSRIREEIYHNILKLVLPHINGMLAWALPDRQRRHLEMIRRLLEDLSLPAASTLRKEYNALTVNEMRVANLIREGFSSKQIAYQLCISVHTVKYYRENIRKKLGVRNQKTNLRSHLMALTPQTPF